MSPGGPRIAVASTGLGHVARGIEAWAADLGAALARRGAAVTLFRGAGPAAHPYERVVPCLRRGGLVARVTARAAPGPAWRLGLKSPYGVEQASFALALIPRLRGSFDIVHTQDPHLALALERARRMGLHGAEVILAHGTEEDDAFLARLRHVQQLAPAHVEAARERGVDVSGWFAVPNFVDLARFRPAAGDGERTALRREIGLEPDALVVLEVAALKRTHKRVDAVAVEVARARALAPGRRVRLVLAGAREPETADALERVRAALGEDLIVLEDAPRERMPALYRLADVLLHGALFEMMPIALLEALASGLPVVAHAESAVMSWMVGGGGALVDMRREGAAAGALAAYLDPALRAEHGRRARRRAEEEFSEEAVVSRILEMYQAVGVRARRGS